MQRFFAAALAPDAEAAAQASPPPEAGPLYSEEDVERARFSMYDRRRGTELESERGKTWIEQGWPVPTVVIVDGEGPDGFSWTEKQLIRRAVAGQWSAVMDGGGSRRDRDRVPEGHRGRRTRRARGEAPRAPVRPARGPRGVALRGGVRRVRADLRELADRLAPTAEDARPRVGHGGVAAAG